MTRSNRGRTQGLCSVHQSHLSIPGHGDIPRHIPPRAVVRRPSNSRVGAGDMLRIHVGLQRPTDEIESPNSAHLSGLNAPGQRDKRGRWAGGAGVRAVIVSLYAAARDQKTAKTISPWLRMAVRTGCEVSHLAMSRPRALPRVPRALPRVCHAFAKAQGCCRRALRLRPRISSRCAAGHRGPCASRSLGPRRNLIWPRPLKSQNSYRRIQQNANSSLCL